MTHKQRKLLQYILYNIWLCNMKSYPTKLTDLRCCSQRRTMFGSSEDIAAVTPFSAKAVWYSRLVIYRTCLFSFSVFVLSWVPSVFLLKKRQLIPWQTTSSNNSLCFCSPGKSTWLCKVFISVCKPVFVLSKSFQGVMTQGVTIHSFCNLLFFYTHLGPGATVSISVITAAQTCISKYVCFLWYRMFFASLPFTHRTAGQLVYFSVSCNGHLLESWLWWTAAMLMYYQGSLFLVLLWDTDDPPEEDRWVC